MPPTGSLNTNVLRKHIDFPVISAGSFDKEPVTWQRGDIWRRVYLKDGMINGYLIIDDNGDWLRRRQSPSNRLLPRSPCPSPQNSSFGTPALALP